MAHTAEADEAFFERMKANPPKTKAEWLELVREAAEKHSTSPLRGDIALWLAGTGLTDVPPDDKDTLDIEPVKDSLYDLEIPDAHIAPGFEEDYTDKELSVFREFAKMYATYKWRKLAELLSERYASQT